MKTFDDIRDLAIRITDNLVEQGLIKNCIDTDCEDEFNTQDIIIGELLNENIDYILSCYKKHTFNKIDDDLIQNAIDYGVLETDDIWADFLEYAIKNLNYMKLSTDFIFGYKEYYENGLTHLENFNKYLSFDKTLIFP